MAAMRLGPTVRAALLASLCAASCQETSPIDYGSDAGAPVACNLRCLYRVPYPEEGGLSGYTERVGTTDLLVLWDGLPARITEDGALEALPLPVPYDSDNQSYATVFTHPLGDRVGWFALGDSTFEIYDLDGTHAASVPLPDVSEYGSLWPAFAADDGRMIFEDWVIDLESSTFKGLTVVDYAGSALSSFVEEEDGFWLDSVKTTRDPDRVYQQYRENGGDVWVAGLLARSLGDCAELFRIPDAREWAIGDDGRHVFALMGDDTLRWFEDGAAEGDAVPTTGAVWNMAVSPSGRFAAASEERVALVDEGALVFQIDRPDYYVLTLDVTDRGDVLLGVASEESDGRVLFLDSDGALLGEVGTGIDDNAWHPWVERVFSQDRFFVRDKEALSLLEIAGRDPEATCGVSLSELCGGD
jgi:hypothetical protein